MVIIGMKGKICAFFFVISCMHFGCQRVKKLPDADFSQSERKERIAYHKDEMRKCQENLIREEGKIRRRLMEYKMNDVRAANDRKRQYERRMEKHKSFIKELELGNE